MARSWQEFQDLVGREIKYLYPESASWKIEPQKPLGEYRVDYFVYKGTQRYVIDAKWVERLEKSDVDQVIEYKKAYNAQKGIIFIAPRTELSPVDLTAYAVALNIEIIPLSTDP